MPIKINSTGGGSVSIDVPSTGGTYTLTAPANNATIFTTDGGAITGNVAFTSNNVTIGGQTASPFGNKNLIINGDMQVWQRGTSFANTSYSGTPYTADRWFVSRNYNTLNSTATQQLTGVTGLSKYALRVQRNSGDTNTTGNFYVLQNIESKNTHDLAGQPVTFSGWVKFGANYSGGTLSVFLSSGTGTDENYYPGFTNATTVCSVSMSPSTSYAKFNITGTVPSNSNQLAAVFIFNPTGTAGASDWFEFTDIQVERGSVATPFERRSYVAELALCQRYYETGGDSGGGVQWSGNATSGAAYYATIPFKVTKRATPTVTPTSINNYGFPSTASTVYMTAGVLSECRFTRTSNSSVNGGYFGDTWTASAEL